MMQLLLTFLFEPHINWLCCVNCHLRVEQHALTTFLCKCHVLLSFRNSENIVLKGRNRDALMCGDKEDRQNKRTKHLNK